MIDSREILKEFFNIHESDEERADRKLKQFFEAYNVDLTLAVAELRKTLEKVTFDSDHSCTQVFDALVNVEDAMTPKLY